MRFKFVMVAAMGVMVAVVVLIYATKPPLYLVGIGDVPDSMMDSLVAHFREKFSIKVATRPPLEFDATTFDARRSQVSAERLIQAVRVRYPKLDADPRVRVIAITPLDMYIEEVPQWRFAFSRRSADQRFAVVSYARMNPRNLGAAPNDTLLQSRLRKMITKNIGIIYFGLGDSTNPRSVLYNNVLGVQELDGMTEEFDPR